MSGGISDTRRMSNEPLSKEMLRDIKRLKGIAFDMVESIGDLGKKLEEDKKINKMKRKDVYRILDNERQYQDTVRKHTENETRNDDEKSVSDFILYMEYTLEKAKKAIYTLNETEALALVRKTTALGVAAGEAFGFPER